MDNSEITLILSCLRICHINVSSIEELKGYMIERDTLLDKTLLIPITSQLEKLRSFLSSTTLTSLQRNAQEKQAFPVINFVRQLLRSIQYEMKPHRVSNGYDENKKKLFKNYFIIQQK